MHVMLLQIVSQLPLTQYSLSSQDHTHGILVDADLRLLGQNDQLLEQIATRLLMEESVSSISWRLLPPSGDHSIGLVDFAIDEEI